MKTQSAILFSLSLLGFMTCLASIMAPYFFSRRSLTPVKAEESSAPTASSAFDPLPPLPQIPQSATHENATASNLANDVSPVAQTSVLNNESYDQQRLILLNVSASDVDRNSAINTLSRLHHGNLESDLIDILHRKNERERFRAFAAQHLGSIAVDKGTSPEDRQVAERELEYLLKDTDRSVRREAFGALSRLRNLLAMDIIKDGLVNNAWSSDRDLMIECLFEQGSMDRMSEIRPFLKDKDPVVRIAALHVLGEWRDQESRATFEEAAASDVQRVNRAGRRALERLALAIDH